MHTDKRGTFRRQETNSNDMFLSMQETRRRERNPPWAKEELILALDLSMDRPLPSGRDETQ